MPIKRVLILIAGLFFYQPIYANDTCDNITIEEVSQFVEANTADWRIFFSLQIFLAQNTHNTEAINFIPGTPIKVYTITPDSIQNYTSQGSFQSALVFRNTWYIPISSSSTYEFLDIRCTDNTLSIVGTAGNQTAEQYRKVSSQIQGQISSGEENHLIIKIETTKHLMLAVEGDSNTTIYPLIEFPNQYSALQPVNDLNGYVASEVLLLIAAEFLNTANVATLTSDLKLNIPKAAYFPATATGATGMFWIDLDYVPNDEGKLLFEVKEYELIK